MVLTREKKKTGCSGSVATIFQDNNKNIKSTKNHNHRLALKKFEAEKEVNNRKKRCLKTNKISKIIILVEKSKINESMQYNLPFNTALTQTDIKKRETMLNVAMAITLKYYLLLTSSQQENLNKYTGMLPELINFGDENYVELELSYIICNGVQFFPCFSYLNSYFCYFFFWYFK